METNTSNTIDVYREVQVIAGMFFTGIRLSLIETLYLRKFNRSIDYGSLGVRNIDELLERMADMVVVFKHREVDVKFVMPVFLAQMRQKGLLKRTVQKFLNRHDGKIMFNSFDALYQDDYKMKFPYRFYGLTDLENVCQTLNDILVVGVEKGEKVIRAVKGYNLRKRKTKDRKQSGCSTHEEDGFYFLYG